MMAKIKTTPEQQQFVFAQDKFHETLENIKQRRRCTRLFANIQAAIAYSLKTIAAGSGLFIAVVNAYRWEPGWSIFAGLATSAAVIVDSILANFKRLMSYAPAYYSYHNLVRGVILKHTNELQKRIGFKVTEPTRFFAEMADVLGNLRNELENTSRRIDELLQKANIDALAGLKLDTHESLAHAISEAQERPEQS